MLTKLLHKLPPVPWWVKGLFALFILALFISTFCDRSPHYDLIGARVKVHDKHVTEQARRYGVPLQVFSYSKRENLWKIGFLTRHGEKIEDTYSRGEFEVLSR